MKTNLLSLPQDSSLRSGQMISCAQHDPLLLILLDIKMSRPMTTTKNELLTLIARELVVNKEDAVKAFQAVFSSIATLLKEDKEIKVRHFGAFYLVHHSDKPGRNPQTGQTLTIAAHKRVAFKSSVVLKALVNEPKPKQKKIAQKKKT